MALPSLLSMLLPSRNTIRKHPAQRAIAVAISSVGTGPTELGDAAIGFPSGGLFLMQLADSSIGTFLASAVLFGRSPGCGAFAERLQTKKTTTISDRGQSVKHRRGSALQRFAGSCLRGFDHLLCRS